MSFDEFFKKATGFGPYPYQKRLAESKEIPDMLNIPTGAGKTSSSSMYFCRHDNYAICRDFLTIIL